MKKSRYERLVVRKPNMMTKGNKEIPIDKWVSMRPGIDTGTYVLCSRQLIPDSNIGFEYGIISGNQIIGTDPVPVTRGGGLGPHKDIGHDHLFCFLGTNPDDLSDLGGEIEFWLGEGDKIDTVTVDTPSIIYVPEGMGMFPMIWRNVKRPIVFCVIASAGIDKPTEIQLPVSMEGRPKVSEHGIKMPGTRYESLVVRKANVMRGKNTEVSVDKVEPLVPGVDTGPIVLMSTKLIKDSKAGFEWGIITGDHIIGCDDNPAADSGMGPHKDVGHDHLFCFLGTNPDNPAELGAEVELWLGEGKETDKVIIDTPSSVYIPEGLGLFPILWRNVKRPVVFTVTASSAIDKETEIQLPVSMEGRPRTL
jgi:hypothetical protein